MKYQILIFLLGMSHIGISQSSFFVGLHSSYGKGTLLNKEDKKAGDLLVQKGKWVPSYGIQLGYRIGNKLSVSIEPNILNYQVNFSGYDKDSVQLVSFNSLCNFDYYNIPLNVSYQFYSKNRFNLSFGIGGFLGYLKKYREEFNGWTRTGVTLIENSTFWQENLKGFAEVPTSISSKTNIDMEKPVYSKINLGLNGKIAGTYAVSEYFALTINFGTSLGLKDIENKTQNTVTYTTSSGTTTNTYNQWENVKFKYHLRAIDDYGNRPATYTFFIGGGLSLNYYFKGGLLPSIHK